MNIWFYWKGYLYCDDGMVGVGFFWSFDRYYVCFIFIDNVVGDIWLGSDRIELSCI